MDICTAIQTVNRLFKDEYDDYLCTSEYISDIVKNWNVKDDDDGYDILPYVEIGPVTLEFDDANMCDRIFFNNNFAQISVYHDYIFIKFKGVYTIKLKVLNHQTIKLVDNFIEQDDAKNKGIGSDGMVFMCTFLKNAGYKQIIGTIGNYDDKKQIVHFYHKQNFTMTENRGKMDIVKLL
jgi:hypothetical protein